MSKVKKLPPRTAVKTSDCWDLASLFKSDGQWETAFKKWEAEIPRYAEFAGRLGESAATLASCLDFDLKFDRAGERLSTYAYLKAAEDQANSTYQRMLGRYQHAASNAAQAGSYIRPEIMAIPAAKMKKFLAAPQLAPHRLTLERLLRYKSHTLGKSEEKLLAMQSQMAETANQVFRQLNDADLKFGALKNEKGETVELSLASYSVFMRSPQRSVRKAAFHQLYDQYQAHEHTLAATAFQEVLALPTGRDFARLGFHGRNASS